MLDHPEKILGPLKEKNSIGSTMGHTERSQNNWSTETYSDDDPPPDALKIVI